MFEGAAEVARAKGLAHNAGLQRHAENQRPLPGLQEHFLELIHAATSFRVV
jgi:hypothetical protein